MSPPTRIWQCVGKHSIYTLVFNIQQSFLDFNQEYLVRIDTLDFNQDCLVRIDTLDFNQDYLVRIDTLDFNQDYLVRIDTLDALQYMGNANTIKIYK